MLIIVSKDISTEALKKLEKYGNIILFATDKITYKAISNHPDIFLFTDNKIIIAAANTPENTINQINKHSCLMVNGTNYIGKAYPQTAHYNALATDNYLVHNIRFTDEMILKHSIHKTVLNIKQAYCRCNLIALANNSFITSDKGIEKKLKKHNLNVLYVNPIKIKLNGFQNGFFGGCCGTSNTHVFFNGSLKFFEEEVLIRSFIENAGMRLIELTHNIPEDIGSILIID